MLFSPYFWLAAIVLGASLFGTGWARGSAHIKAQIAAEAAQHIETVTEATDKVVTVYVDKIEHIPGPTIVRTRLVDRVCPGSGPGVPDSGGSDAGSTADAGNRLALDLANSVRNREQLRALQEAVKANNER